MGEIVLCKGLTADVITINPGATLSTVRKQITPSIIDDDDGKTGSWRFISKLFEADEDGNAPEPAPKAAERMFDARLLMGKRNVLYMIDANKIRPPDLVGFKSTKFINGPVECEIWGNEKFLTDKFKPLMFGRVRPSDGTEAIFDNMLLCQEKTPIVMRVRANGYSTFGCTIKSPSADKILLDNLIARTGDDKVDAALVLRQFPDSEQFILTDGVPDKKTYVEYRMLIEVWKVGDEVSAKPLTTKIPKEIIGSVDINVYSCKDLTDAESLIALNV